MADKQIEVFHPNGTSYLADIETVRNLRGHWRGKGAFELSLCMVAYGIEVPRYATCADLPPHSHLSLEAIKQRITSGLAKWVKGRFEQIAQRTQIAAKIPTSPWIVVNQCSVKRPHSPRYQEPGGAPQWGIPCSKEEMANI